MAKAGNQAEAIDMLGNSYPRVQLKSKRAVPTKNGRHNKPILEFVSWGPKPIIEQDDPDGAVASPPAAEEPKKARRPAPSRRLIPPLPETSNMFLPTKSRIVLALDGLNTPMSRGYIEDVLGTRVGGRALNTLHEAGLVRRIHLPNDRTLYAPTQKGRQRARDTATIVFQRHLTKDQSEPLDTLLTTQGHLLFALRNAEEELLTRQLRAAVTAENVSVALNRLVYAHKCVDFRPRFGTTAKSTTQIRRYTILPKGEAACEEIAKDVEQLQRGQSL